MTPNQEPSERELWESGCLTRYQAEYWTDGDLKRHIAGVRKTLKHLFSLIDKPASKP